MTQRKSSSPVTDARRMIDALEAELRRGLIGQEGLLRGLLIGLLADGHVLIEGVPGLGKTRAVNLLARACQMRFKRIQFTPDLLPSDITGTRIYRQTEGDFEVIEGPIFANLVLADEINRAPPKVQSALLETMQERQVTIGRESRAVPLPFLVFATQNPIEQEGTYPLPEAQLDRFLLKLVVRYPEREHEREIVELVIDETELPAVNELLTRHEVAALQQTAREVFIEERVIRYGVDLVRATRRGRELGLELAPYVELGASPRASIALAQAARAGALIDGRDAATPDDVKSVAHRVLRHRVLLNYHGQAENVTTDAVVDEILATVAVP